MPPDDLVAQRRPIRLPVDFAQAGLVDAVGAFAIGLALALAVLIVARPFLTRRGDGVEEARQQIASLATLGTEERVLGLARLLARLDDGQPRPAELDDALYRPDAPADLAALEAAVLSRAVRRGSRR